VIFGILATPATLNADYYMSYFFRRPHPAIAFPSPMTITVIGDLSPATAGNLGSRTAISPDEPRHAHTFAIARAIDAGLSTSELLSWNNLIVVSALITFKPVTTWLSTNARASIGAQFAVVYFSTVPPCSQIPTTAIPNSSLTRHAFLAHPPCRMCNGSFSSPCQRPIAFTTCQSLSAPDH
jgi:hypothetical protein